MQSMSGRLAALCIVVAAGLAVAADQVVLGTSFSVKDPRPGVDATRRSLRAAGTQADGAATLVGDPTRPDENGGAVLEVRASGGTPTRQTFVLAQGRSSSGKPFWAPSGSSGYSYADPAGEQGPVRKAKITRSSGGALKVKVRISGKHGPLDVLPPDPGTSACVALQLGIAPEAGDRYSLQFGPDSRITNTGNTRFTAKKPSLSGVCPRGPVTVRSVAPEATDPLIDTRAGDHVVAVPLPGTRVGRLVVFFPGTGGRPDQYTSVVRRAAERGHHAIALDYENSASINFQVCPGQPPSCHEAARLEILTGQESPYIEPDVDPTNSAFNRLARLLAHQQLAHPDEGWDVYLAGDTPRWERIVAAGHSQGGGHAAMTAKLNAVARVLLFGATEPAAWTLASFATPANRFWGLVHADELVANGVLLSWTNLGLPGAPVEIELSPPPDASSHRLVTTVSECGGDPMSNGYYHNCYTVDGWMPAPSPDGSPAFGPIWDHMLTR